MSQIKPHVCRYEHETETLRRQLAAREQGRDQNRSMWEQKEVVSCGYYAFSSSEQQQP